MENMIENYMIIRLAVACAAAGGAYALIAVYRKCRDGIRYLEKRKSAHRGLHYRHAHSM